MPIKPPVPIPQVNNLVTQASNFSATGSAKNILSNVGVNTPSNPNSLPSLPSSGSNVASLVNPNTIDTLKSLKENPKTFGDQITDQAKQKAISAATNSTYVKLKLEQVNLIQEGIQLDITHQLTLEKLEKRNTPKKQYVNGEVRDIPPELSNEEYQIAVAVENKNYEEEKIILQAKKDQNKQDLEDYKKDPFKKIKEQNKKRKEARTKRKNRTKEEKRKARKAKAKAILSNAKKTLAPILISRITEETAKIIAQNQKIKELVDNTNAIITDANNTQDPLKLSNAKLARDNAIKIINDNEAKITKIIQTVNKISSYISIFSIIVNIISNIPIPVSVPPGIGIPVNVIMKLVKILNKADRILSQLSAYIPQALSALQQAVDILEDYKSQLLNINTILEVSSVSEITNLVTTIQVGTFPEIYKGFKFAIREESGPRAIVVRGYKRHYAVAIDNNNVEVLKSDLSFTLDPNDLIETLKVIIDRENLIA